MESFARCLEPLLVVAAAEQPTRRDPFTRRKDCRGVNAASRRSLPTDRELRATPSRGALVPLEFLQQPVGAFRVFVPGIGGVDELSLHRDYRIVCREALLKGHVRTAPNDLERHDCFFIIALPHGVRGGVRGLFDVGSGFRKDRLQLGGGFLWISWDRCAARLVGLSATLEKHQRHSANDRRDPATAPSIHEETASDGSIP